MKKYFVVIVVLFSATFLWSAPKVVNLANNTNYVQDSEFNLSGLSSSGFNISFKLNKMIMDFETYNGKSYDVVRIPGAEPSLKTGYPDVQSLGYFLQVVDAKELKVEIVSSSKKVFKDINLLPVKKYPFRCGGGKPEIIMNRNSFGSDSLYPGNLFEIDKPGNFRDILVSKLSINPIQYNPVTKELVVYSNIELKVKYIGSSMRKSLNNKASNVFYRIMAKKLPNFRADTSRVEQNEVMLLIAAAEFLNNSESLLPEFIQKKRMLGIDVIVKNVNEIGNKNTNIKEYVQDAYDNWTVAPTYLLLVGNENSVETFKRPTSAGSAASDYVYSLLDGNDIYPDLLYGRIVADDVLGANIHLNKIIQYEWNPEAGALWYKKALGIASNEGSNPSDEDYIRQVKKHLTDYTYNYMDEFFQGSGNATKENINSALNEGRSWLTYVGHGSGTSWGSTNGYYKNNHIDELENNLKMPMIVDVACKNGEFDSTYESFGEKWVRSGSVESPKGAVAYWGGSVNISWHPPAIMARGIAKYHFEKPVYTVGGSLIAGQLYLAEQAGTSSDVEDNFEWYNLFGDPSMLLRTDTPKEFSFTGGDIIGLGENSYKGNVGVTGARATLFSKTDGIIATAITDSSGDFNLSFQPMTKPEDMFITVYKYNYTPFLKKVEVIPLDGPYMVYDSKNVVSETGFEDLMPNPGEKIHYNLIFNNIGGDVADSIDLRFSTEDPFVLEHAQSLSFGLVEAGSAAEIGGFYFKLHESVYNNHIVKFKITWTAGDKSGASNISFLVAAPEMQFVSLDVHSDSNNNGFVDPGEEASLKLIVKNVGQIPSSSGSYKIFTRNGGITFINDELAFNNVEAGEEVFALIKFKVSSNILPGEVIDFFLEDSVNGSGENSVLSLPIGTPKKELVVYNGNPIRIIDLSAIESTLQGPRGIIETIRVRLDIQHTYVGDLVITLVSPENENVVLRNKIGGGNKDINVWIPDDEAPAEPLDKFHKSTEGGTWKLIIEDKGRGDEGFLNSWKLDFYGYFE